VSRISDRASFLSLEAAVKYGSKKAMMVSRNELGWESHGSVRCAIAAAATSEGPVCGHRRRPRSRFAPSDIRMGPEGRKCRKWIAAEVLPTIGGPASTQCSRTFC
jgi:hypothetical protein